jgi:predicted nucleic acid-binding protein
MLSTADAQHAACVAQFAELRPPLFTCWPAITEAAWLLRKSPKAIDGLFHAFEVGVCDCLTLDESAIPWIKSFLSRYRNLGAQLADAALVYLAERDGFETIFTLDRRDFSIYRFGKNKSLRLLPQ